MHSARAVLKAGQEVKLKARGRSMLPAIQTGDVVTIRPVSCGAIAVGDIIAYEDVKRNKGLVCHRVVGVRGQAYLVKGDTYLRYTERVPVGEVLGKAVAVERAGRTIDLERGFWRFSAPSLGRISRRLPGALFIFACICWILHLFRLALVRGCQPDQGRA